ncbi:MAG: Pyruvate phosphate dikinase, partial [Streblomastix strix]
RWYWSNSNLIRILPRRSYPQHLGDEHCLARNEHREIALAKLLPPQRRDFKGLYEFLGFLQRNLATIRVMAEGMKIIEYRVRQLCDKIYETNPVLRFRGVCIGVVYTEICKMQVRAIFEAAAENVKEKSDFKFGCTEVMVSELAHENEMRFMRELCVIRIEPEI